MMVSSFTARTPDAADAATELQIMRAQQIVDAHPAPTWPAALIRSRRPAPNEIVAFHTKRHRAYSTESGLSQDGVYPK